MNIFLRFFSHGRERYAQSHFGNNELSPNWECKIACAKLNIKFMSSESLPTHQCHLQKNQLNITMHAKNSHIYLNVGFDTMFKNDVLY